MHNESIIGIILAIIGYISIIMATVGAYFTHVIWAVTLCLEPNVIMTGGKIFLIILGLLIPPVGMVHGWFIWFS